MLRRRVSWFGVAGSGQPFAAGVDVLNMQQPQAYGIEELGRQFAGKVCFLTTADVQATIPTGNVDKIRQEVRQLVEHWSTPDGGLIVFNYGVEEAIGGTPEATAVMFDEFKKNMVRGERA